jgi:hypothetical protein
VDKLNHFSSNGHVPQVESYGKPASVATMLPFGQHGFVTNTQKIKKKLAPRASAALYMSGVGNTTLRIYYPANKTFGTCRAADFRSYCASKDPTNVAPVPVVVLPPEQQDQPVAFSANMHEPMPDIALPPKHHPEISAYELETLQAPDDGRHADKSTAAYLAEQQPLLPRGLRTIREAMCGPDAEQWQKVYNSELDNLFDKGTFLCRSGKTRCHLVHHF